jgi:hypothetical protein
MKKIFSAMPGILLTAGMLGISAQAHAAATATLTSSGAAYGTLHEAVAAAAPAGDTITVTGTLTESTHPINITTPITITGPGEVDFTDTNITWVSNQYYYWLTCGSTLTIKNMKLVATGSSPIDPNLIAVGANCTLDVENSTLVPGLSDGYSATVTYDKNQGHSFAIDGGSPTSTVTVNNTTISAATTTDGSCQPAMNSGTGIYAHVYNGNSWIISNDTFTGTFGGKPIIIDADGTGSMTISGNTFDANTVSSSTPYQIMYDNVSHHTNPPAVGLDLENNIFNYVPDTCAVTNGATVAAVGVLPSFGGSAVGRTIVSSSTSTITGNTFAGYPTNSAGQVTGIYDQGTPPATPIEVGTDANTNTYSGTSGGTNNTSYLFGLAYSVVFNPNGGTFPTTLAAGQIAGPAGTIEQGVTASTTSTPTTVTPPALTPPAPPAPAGQTLSGWTVTDAVTGTSICPATVPCSYPANGPIPVAGNIIVTANWLARAPASTSSAPTLDRWALLLLGMLATGMAWMVLRKPQVLRK